MAAPVPPLQLRSTDFPKGLVDQGSLDRLFQILNPIISASQGVTTSGTNLAQNIDGQFAQFQLKTPDSDWAAPTLQNSWVDTGQYAPVGYRKDLAGNVWLRGALKSGTPNTTMFTLPVGFRPAGKQSIAGVDKNDGLARIEVNTDGTVVQHSGQGGGPGGLSFFCSFPCTDYAPGVYAGFPQSVRLKDGKKPVSVLAWAFNTSTNQVEGTFMPAWTYLGSGQQGNLLRVDNILGLRIGQPYLINLFVFF